MTTDNYTQPVFKEKAFNCPYCNAYAQQFWNRLAKYITNYVPGDLILDQYGGEYWQSECYKCKISAIWNSQEKMIVPLACSAPSPSKDMPEDVKTIYEEARQVQPFSPRATAALLRVALEKLLEHLEEGNGSLYERKGSLYERIRNLEKKGFPDLVIKSFDIVRICGNEGSHAGTIDFTGKDDQDTVNQLFFLVNFTVEQMITVPKNIEEQFSQLQKKKTENLQKSNKH